MTPIDYTKPFRRRVLEDGRILELWAMIFNWRLTVTLPENDGITIEDLWCWKGDRFGEALAAFHLWDGQGEPEGWNKHPPTSRWREDGTAASEINQRDERP